jgi:hypothetical protein
MIDEKTGGRKSHDGVFLLKEKNPGIGFRRLSQAKQNDKRFLKLERLDNI